jgi:hypothetical protein
MTEQELAERLVRRLDEGLDDLSPGVAYRLRLARDKAVARLQEDVHTSTRPVNKGRRLLVPTFMLAIAFCGLLIWQYEGAQKPKADIADLDAQVLSEELPVTAYLDQGFEVWLYHDSTE